MYNVQICYKCTMYTFVINNKCTIVQMYKQKQIFILSIFKCIYRQFCQHKHINMFIILKTQNVKQFLHYIYLHL